MRGPGLNGLAVAMAAAGSVLLVSGLKNATVSDTLRAILKGDPIPSSTATSVELVRGSVGTALAGMAYAGAVHAAGGSALGQRIAQAGLAERGKPYKWAAGGPNAFDCSGLVNWVLGHQLGLPIPRHPDGKYTGHGPTSGEYYLWSGLTTVSSPQVGDLVCYRGHIAIAIGPTQMVHAPTAGDVVRVRDIYGAPGRIFRRVKGA